MRQLGRIIWWGRREDRRPRNYGIVEVRNAADFSITKFFLHRRNIIKSVPEFPAIDQYVVFEIKDAPKEQSRLQEAVEAELYLTLEQAKLALSVTEVKSC